jgi:hypothetical protein
MYGNRRRLFMLNVEFPRSNSNRNEGQTLGGFGRSGRFGRRYFVPTVRFARIGMGMRPRALFLGVFFPLTITLIPSRDSGYTDTVAWSHFNDSTPTLSSSHTAILATGSRECNGS